MHEDLRTACLAALELKREDAAAHARKLLLARGDGTVRRPSAPAQARGPAGGRGRADSSGAV